MDKNISAVTDFETNSFADSFFSFLIRFIIQAIPGAIIGFVIDDRIKNRQDKDENKDKLSYLYYVILQVVIYCFIMYTIKSMFSLEYIRGFFEPFYSGSQSNLLTNIQKLI